MTFERAEGIKEYYVKDTSHLPNGLNLLFNKYGYIVGLILSEIIFLFFIFKWPISVGVFALLIFAIFTFDKPEILFGVFIFTLVVDSMDLQGANFRIRFPLTSYHIAGSRLVLTDAFLGVLIIQNIIYNLITKKSFRLLKAIRWPFLFFWSVATISLLMGFFLKGYGKSALSEFKIILYSLALPITTNILKDKHHLKYIINAILLGALILAVIILYNLLKTNIFVDIRYQAATHYASGRQALYLSFAFLLLYIRYLFNRNSKESVKIALVLAATGALLVVAQIRSLYISLPLALLFIYFLLDSETKHRYLKSTVILVIGSVFFVLLANLLHSGLLLKRIAMSGGGVANYQEDPSAYFRVVAWVQEINRIKKTPWLGQGFGSSFYFKTIHGVIFKGLDPHNAYITIALKTGLIGLFAFLTIIISFYKRSFDYFKMGIYTTNQKELTFVLVAIINVLVFIGFNAELQECGSAIFIWILMGMGMFLIEQHSRDISVGTVI